jgi:hypothetical protein
MGMAGQCLVAAEAEDGAAIQDHVEAGEYGLAIDEALAVTNPQEQTALLKQIAQAQANAGDTFSAAATLRRIPMPRERSQAVNQQLALLGGGGAMANPGPLMMLIRNNTSGEWEQEEGLGGTLGYFPTGVKVSPNGVLERITAKEQSKRLATLGVEARKADLNGDLARPSALRLVSLTRLNRELSDLLAAGRSVPASMALLAGLTKIQYVFVFPEEGEIVLGGPAEGWEYNAQGLPIGTQSKRPIVQLDDFVTVFRTFERGDGDFGCSIETREENIKALQEFVQDSQARGPLSAGAGVRIFVNQIARKLGRQDIVVWGIPAESRVARVIVEADYRMKLIGVDKHDAGKDIPSYFDLLPQDLQRDPAPMEALRWWLTMKYDAVLHNADKTVFEFQGPSVLCQSENQLLTAEGKHLPTGKSEGVNRLFAENFTNNYDKLASRDLVFADARNVFDLALAAALICKEGLVEQANGSLQVFASGGLYAPQQYTPPKEVDSVVNHRVYNGRDVVVQAAGGVRADLTEVLGNEHTVKSSRQLDRVAQATERPKLPSGRWWWDATK